MYAPAHVATALAVKRKFPAAPFFALMIATQLIEFLWVVLSYLGVEYQTVDSQGVLHLDYLPYSHSILTGFGVALLAYIVIRWGLNRPVVALAVAIATGSHIVYDIVQHEPNIQIAWFIGQPRFGLDVGSIPLLDFVIEAALAIACWWYFKGSWKLLVAVLFLTVTDLPMMFSDGNGRALADNHFILPTIILAQTAVTLLLIWVFAQSHSDELARDASSLASTGKQGAAA
jgi:hypothetical protein